MLSICQPLLISLSILYDHNYTTLCSFCGFIYFHHALKQIVFKNQVKYCFQASTYIILWKTNLGLCLNNLQSPTVGTYCRLWPNVGGLVLCTKQPTLDCVTIKVLKWLPNSRVMYTMRTNVPKTFSVLKLLINLLSLFWIIFDKLSKN